MTGSNQSIRRSDDMPSLATFNKIAILACVVLSQFSCLTSGMTLPQQYSYKLASLEDEVMLFTLFYSCKMRFTSDPEVENSSYICMSLNEILIFKYAYFCKLLIIIPRSTQNMIHFSSNMLLLLIFCVVFIHFRETLKHLKRLVKSFYETFPLVHLLNTEVLSNF